MRMIRNIIMVCLASASMLHGQVTVDIGHDQEKFLRDESLSLTVRVTNLSGQTLDMGDDNTWLKFTVVNLDGSIVIKLAEVPVEGKFTLKSSQTAHRLVDLMPYYGLMPGRYQVTATVNIREWAQNISSQPVTLEIIQGTTIWEQVVGIPKEEGPPELRKFSLQQARNQKDLYLYARITDENDSRAHKVLSLGKLVSFSQPEPQIDAESNLHVLFQYGARSFNYSVIDPDGNLVRRQRHDYAGSRPKLTPQSGGKVDVTGGIRRLTRNDFPPPSTTPPADEVPLAEP